MEKVPYSDLHLANIGTKTILSSSYSIGFNLLSTHICIHVFDLFQLITVKMMSITFVRDLAKFVTDWRIAVGDGINQVH